MAKKSDGETATKKDEQYRLTPVGCLYAVLKDYAGEDGMLNVNKIQGRYGEHIVEDFMDAMVKAGYLERKSDEKEEDVLHSDLHEGR